MSCFWLEVVECFVVVSDYVFPGVVCVCVCACRCCCFLRIHPVVLMCFDVESGIGREPLRRMFLFGRVRECVFWPTEGRNEKNHTRDNANKCIREERESFLSNVVVVFHCAHRSRV